MKHKWKIVKETEATFVEICQHCDVLILRLKEDNVPYLVEEPYHPVGGGELCPETCEETQIKITIDTVMKS